MTVAAPTVTKVSNYINGRWTESTATDWLDVTNPATAEVLARVPLSDASEVAAAVEAAAAAYPEWRRTPPEDRIQPLFKLKQLLEDHLDELSRLITQENGKTFTESKAELRRAIESLAPDAYEKLSYYERWITAIETLLVEKGILTREEIDRKVESL